MRMSHIYQPLMLMELLGRRSPAPAQDVARRILGEDVTQIDYYTERVKRMVGKVLTGNGITRYDQGAYDLVGGEELSDAERDELLQLCRQRLDAFRMQRGEEVFAHRSRHRTPISGSIKYRVLTRAKGRCECCGAHEHQRALEVDHIVPRNQGGSDDLSNLQALCFRCNAGKRDAVCLRKRAPPTSADCRPATPIARTVVRSARWRPAAGCCWRTNWRSASPMPIR
jgi:5-methylcytosine-specific restriction endonuclease McrA